MAAPLRSMIIDDEPLARKLLRSMLDEYPDVEVVGEYSDGGEVLEALAEERPDLLFLDIQMPVRTGIEVLQTLGREHAPAVIFVTAYNQYALDAFEVNAVDYLLKPFDEERLKEAVDRARRRISTAEVGEHSDRIVALLERLDRRNHPLEHIVVKRGEKMFLQPTDEIAWFEADGKYIRIHTGGRQDVIRETMTQLERELDPRRFLRVSRSAIVNIHFIKEIQPWFKGDLVITLQDGSQVSTTRTYRDALKRLITRA